MRNHTRVLTLGLNGCNPDREHNHHPSSRDPYLRQSTSTGTARPIFQVSLARKDAQLNSFFSPLSIHWVHLILSWNNKHACFTCHLITSRDTIITMSIFKFLSIASSCRLLRTNISAPLGTMDRDMAKTDHLISTRSIRVREVSKRTCSTIHRILVHPSQEYLTTLISVDKERSSFTLDRLFAL